MTKRRIAALAAALFLSACGPGDDPGAGTQSVGDVSEYDSFEPLLGVGAVVEATVVGHRGPRSELNQFGAVEYPGRPDDAALWTTPLGLPALVLEDIRLVETVGGSDRADRVAAQAVELASAESSMEVLAPVGVFADGETYQFWVSGWEESGFLVYLAFDSADQLVEGLGLSDPDDAFKKLQDFTQKSRTDSLVDLARELNESKGSAEQGPIMDYLFGPVATGDTRNEAFYPMFADELPADRTSLVELEVLIVGADPKLTYGLQGTKILGWSDTNEDGEASVRGWVPAGEEMALVTLNARDDRSDLVTGSPSFVVESPHSPQDQLLRVLYQLEPDGTATVTSGLSLPEIDVQRRSAQRPATEG